MYNGIPSHITSQSLAHETVPITTGSQFLPHLLNSNNSSPGSTFPRRPPRSKHDLSLPPLCSNGGNAVTMSYSRLQKSCQDSSTREVIPSQEAPHRVLIGTQMLQGSHNCKGPSYIQQLMPQAAPVMSYNNGMQGQQNGNNQSGTMSTKSGKIATEVSFDLFLMVLFKWFKYKYAKA